MAETDGVANTNNSDKAEDSPVIITFPERLRAEADGGSAHVRFKVLNEDNDGPTVHLFIPQGFSVPDAAAYTTMDLGLVGAFEDAAVAGGTVTEADITNSVASSGALIGNSLGSSTVGALLGGATQLRKGIATNPYTETQYTGSNIRSFGFTFKLVSESSSEADTALAIENLFRENMYPDDAGANTLKYPNRFKIEFYNGSKPNKYMPKIIECYLVTFNTTYNSTTNAFHDKGQPVEVDIACTFQEVKALIRQDLYPKESEDSEDSEEGTTTSEDTGGN